MAFLPSLCPETVLTPPHSKNFKVAIVGGGMGGLVLAAGLTRGGLHVDIFEQAPKFEETGAGVGIGVNALYALRTLGILDPVLQKFRKPLERRPFLFLSGLPDHQKIFDYPALESDVGMAVHRAEFLDILISLIPDEIVHFNKRCTAVLQGTPGKVILSFDDGTAHTTDMVVGCDGIKSVIRRTVSGRPSDIKFTRTVAFRGLVPMNVAATVCEEVVRPVLFVGLEKHVVMYPIQDGQLVNIVAFSTDRYRPAEEQAPAPGEPWVVPSTRAELISHFEEWGHKAVNLLRTIENPRKWYLHAVDPPLGSYVQGCVALLGDSAHAMLPHLGAGAGQAMEDACILSQLLTHPLTNVSNLESVLEAYDYVRRPRANRVLVSSRDTGEIYQHHGPNGGSLEGLQKDLDGIWDWVWHYDLEKDFRDAIEFLESRNVLVPGGQRAGVAH